MSWSDALAAGRVLKGSTVVLAQGGPDGAGGVEPQGREDRAREDAPWETEGPGPEPSEAGSEAVRREVEAVLRAAREEAQAVREAAYGDGHKEGVTAGYREGLQQAHQEMRAIVQEAQQEAQELRQASVQSLGRLACELASHLLGVALTLDPGLVERAAGAILEEARPLGVLSLAVAPADLEAARRARARWQGDLGGEVEVALIPDPTLPQGALRVETRSGAVERVWPERLAEMDRVMGEVASDLGIDDELGA